MKGRFYILEFSRLPLETEEDLIFRIGSQKELIGSWQEIADILNEILCSNYSECRYRRKYALIAKRRGSSQKRNVVSGERQSVIINADRSEISEKKVSIPDEKLHDCEYLLKLHGYDPHYFELVTAQNSQWDSASGDKKLYSSKIKVKPQDFTLTKEDFAEWFDTLDRNYTPKPLPKRPPQHKDDPTGNLLIIPISDLHFALRSSELETGAEYNCEIAKKIFNDIIDDVIERTNNRSISRILFTIGGDMANADNLSATTTKGTPQDQCVGYYDMVRQLYFMVVEAIDTLANIADVDVLLISSNHDKTVGYGLSLFCKAWFRNDERVTVDCSPMPRKYYRFGQTLFVFAHDGDVKKLPRLIADEARELWSCVNMTEVFLQHLHTEAVLLEESHMRIQRLPTASVQSSWSVGQGYRSKRQCKSFVFNFQDGLTDVLYTNF